MAALSSELETRTRPFAYYSLISRSLLNLCMYVLFFRFFLSSSPTFECTQGFSQPSVTVHAPGYSLWTTPPPGFITTAVRSVRSVRLGSRSVGRSVFPSQPSFFMQARCLSRSVENVQCSEYMHCFPQNEDSKSLPVSLGCEGWPGPITSHRTVSLPPDQSPGSPATRYPVHAACTVYSTACISIPVTRTRSVHSGVHTLQRPPPAPAAAAQLCPMGLTLSVLTYTISTSTLCAFCTRGQ